MQLLNLLIESTENVVCFQCSEKIVLFVNGELSEKALNQLFDFGGNVSVIINLHAIKLDGIILPNVQLRLVKYGNEYDIDFNFDYNELRNIDMTALIDNLHAHAKNIALELGITSFYGGIEPASDEDTRYFTNEEKGPLTV